MPSAAVRDEGALQMRQMCIRDRFALCIGFCIDLLIGDPHGLPHPVASIGHLISLLERLFRRLFPKTPGGERAAGACIWILTRCV